jgi:hypothetical protein
MKKSGDIASLWKNYEAKKKQASSPSPSVAQALPEGQIEEQESVLDQHVLLQTKQMTITLEGKFILES